MLNTYRILNPDWLMLEIPENYIYHDSMEKYIEDRDNIEKYDFLMITPYIIHSKSMNQIITEKKVRTFLFL